MWAEIVGEERIKMKDVLLILSLIFVGQTFYGKVII